MGRPARILRTVSKNIALPEDLVSRIELELYSDLEEKIPFGAQQRFFEEVLREHFRIQDEARSHSRERTGA